MATAVRTRIWCPNDLSVLDHADGLCSACTRVEPAPLRLTVRGQRLAAALLFLLLAGGLVGAFVVGQDLRCQRLQDAHSPLAAQHCPTPTTSEENP